MSQNKSRTIKSILMFLILGALCIFSFNTYSQDSILSERPEISKVNEEKHFNFKILDNDFEEITTDVLLKKDYTKEDILNKYKEMGLISEETQFIEEPMIINGIVGLNFNQEFYNHNLGSYYESVMLECLTDTFMEYYGVKETVLSVMGRTYESGHIATSSYYLND